jgi:hypothetical protein
LLLSFFNLIDINHLDAAKAISMQNNPGQIERLFRTERRNSEL